MLGNNESNLDHSERRHERFFLFLPSSQHYPFWDIVLTESVINFRNFCTGIEDDFNELSTELGPRSATIDVRRRTKAEKTVDGVSSDRWDHG